MKQKTNQRQSTTARIQTAYELDSQTNQPINARPEKMLQMRFINGGAQQKQTPFYNHHMPNNQLPNQTPTSQANLASI